MRPEAMTPEQKAAYIMAMTAGMMAEIAGMQAENQQRIHRGESIAYPEGAFNDLVVRHNLHHNAVLDFFRT